MDFNIKDFNDVFKIKKGKKAVIPKYKNKKGKETDSKLEIKYFNLFKILEQSGEILAVKRLKKGEDSIILKEGGYVEKNNKVSKVQDIKYTPDFLLLDVNSNIPIGSRSYKVKDKVVYVEIKTEKTKTDAYQIRKKMFILKLKEGETFLEIEETNKNRSKKFRVDIYKKLP